MECPATFEDAASMRQYSREMRRQGRRIGLVPTMVRASPHLRTSLVSIESLLKRLQPAGQLA